MDIFEKSPERILSLEHFSQKAEIDIVGKTQKITGRLDVGSQYHNHIEPQTCVCVPIEDGMNVYSATQYVDATQMAVADALKLPNNVINMEVRRLGGAYGAKISRSIQIACAAAVAARLLRRTVRFIMTIEANMTCIGKRYACIADYDVDFDGNGKIQKLLSDYVEDSGCSPNEPSINKHCVKLLLIITQIFSFQFTFTPPSSPTTATTTKRSRLMPRPPSPMHLQALGVALRELLKV